MLFGTVWDAIFGFVAHRATRGRQDWVRTLVKHYDALVDDYHATHAARSAAT